MPTEEEVRLAREKALNAEEALSLHMHSAEYDAEECRRLAENARAARDELLDTLARYWPDKWGTLDL